MRLLAALALALALSGVAVADHVFSHRVYVVGRVVDRDGLPAAGLRFDVAFHGLAAQPAECALDPHPDVTDAHGDLVQCYHAHALADNVTATVSAGAANATIAIDPLLREANVTLQLAGPRAARDVQGDRDFAASVRVHGRLMEPVRGGPLDVERVLVNATPSLATNVTVRLVDANGSTLANATAATDDEGHYDVDLRVGALPAGARAIVHARDAEWDAAVSPLFRRVDALALLGDAPADIRMPGTGKVPAGGPALVLVAAITACGALARRRRGAR